MPGRQTGAVPYDRELADRLRASLGGWEDTHDDDLGVADGVGRRGEEVAPHLGAGRGVEVRVVQREVDAGVEGLVELDGAVRGEDEDAAEVLEHAQEDGDALVACGVVRIGVAALEEGVGFLE